MNTFVDFPANLIIWASAMWTRSGVSRYAKEHINQGIVGQMASRGEGAQPIQ
jgi:hypothetical protein